VLLTWKQEDGKQQANSRGGVITETGALMGYASDDD